MTLASYGNVADTVKLGPGVGARLIGPDIVEPSNPVGSTKADDS
jgi:hypothetical protein